MSVLLKFVTSEQAPENSQQLLTEFSSYMSEAMVITDATRKIQWVNQSFTRITGYSLEEVIGENPNILNSNVHPPSFFEHFWYEIQTRGVWRGNIWNKNKHGNIYQEFLSVHALRERDNTTVGYVGVFQDIDELKKYHPPHEQHEYLNPITRLPNREKLLLDYETNYGKNLEYSALMYIDLDRFRALNDSIGHFMGDTCLKHVSQRLKTSVAPEHSLYHLCGDEFLLLIFGKQNTNQIKHLAHEILQVISSPLSLSSKDEIRMTASIGIFLLDAEEKSNVDEWVRKADMALYYAKKNGKNQVCVYTEKLGREIEHTFTIEQYLHTALENQEFYTVFQPQVNLKTHEIQGFEALIRWCNPVLGMVPPNDFIVIAEETGQIVKIGEWVLKDAMSQMVSMEKKWVRKLNLSVNVSAVQLYNPHFVQMLRTIIDSTGYSPTLLTLEITESSLVKNVHECSRILTELKTMGIKISLDDFGTGYSSLSHLMNFPLDEVKIDRSFISQLPVEPINQSIVRSIVDIAETKKIEVIAEGIEAMTEVDLLTRLGCEMGQGYHYYKPALLQEFVSSCNS